MSTTFDTSHFEMSPSKVVLANMPIMLVILDTSHSPTGLCGPSKQSPLVDTLRHASIALLSSEFDRGENDRGENIWAVVIPRVAAGVHTVCPIDPDELSNIRFLLAFE